MDTPRTSKTTVVPGGKTWRRLRRLLPISLAVALTLTLGTADAWARANDGAPARTVAETPAATRPRVESSAPAAEPAFDDLYAEAEREAQALGLETFSGGDVVIIGGTGLVILLLVILIILIL